MNLASTFRKIAALVRRSSDPATCWKEALELATENNVILMTAPILNDIASIASQLRNLFTRYPVPDNISFWWFGLVELEGLGGKTDIGFYLGGGSGTESGNEQLTHGVFFRYPPKENILQSTVLSLIKTQALLRPKDQQVLEYLVMFSAAGVISKFAAIACSLGSPVFTGFESGDFACVYGSDKATSITRQVDQGSWYSAIQFSDPMKEAFIATDYDLKGIDKSQLEAGKRIEDWDSETWVQSVDEDADGDPDDVVRNILLLPIYSPRLQSLIREDGISGIQFLPVKILHRDGSNVKGFAIANLLNTAPAIDLNQSIYQISEDDELNVDGSSRIDIMSKIVLRGDALKGRDIIRPREYPIQICVSHRFRSLFQEANCTGYRFQKLEIS